MYAMGVLEIDNMLMLLSVSEKMADKERDVIMPLMIEGFEDCARQAGTSVRGGQTSINPWVIVGGVATSICKKTELIIPEFATIGDVLILTKPLGTQVAVNAHQWIEKPDRWQRIQSVITVEQVRTAYQRAMKQMSRLNRIAAQLLHKYDVHACTDVTGFGILGHSQNLVKHQQNEVDFVIHNLPIIANMTKISVTCNNAFGLLRGTSAETSGGLLIVLPGEQAAAFCREIEALEGCPAWIVGVVEKGSRTARLADQPKVIEVPSIETDGEF